MIYIPGHYLQWIDCGSMHENPLPSFILYGSKYATPFPKQGPLIFDAPKLSSFRIPSFSPPGRVVLEHSNLVVYEYAISRSAIANVVSCPSLNRQLIEDRSKEEDDDHKELTEFWNYSVSLSPSPSLSKKLLLPENLMSKNPASEQLRYGLHMALIHLQDIELADQIMVNAFNNSPQHVTPIVLKEYLIGSTFLGFYQKTVSQTIPSEREKKEKEGYTKTLLGQIMDMLPMTDMNTLPHNDVLSYLKAYLDDVSYLKIPSKMDKNTTTKVERIKLEQPIQRKRRMSRTEMGFSTPSDLLSPSPSSAPTPASLSIPESSKARRSPRQLSMEFARSPVLSNIGGHLLSSPTQNKGSSPSSPLPSPKNPTAVPTDIESGASRFLQSLQSIFGLQSIPDNMISSAPVVTTPSSSPVIDIQREIILSKLTKCFQKVTLKHASYFATTFREQQAVCTCQLYNYIVKTTKEKLQQERESYQKCGTFQHEHLVVTRSEMMEFQLLQNFHHAIQSQMFPIPVDFIDHFAELALKCLPRNVFEQYVLRGVVQVTPKVLINFLKAKGVLSNDENQNKNGKTESADISRRQKLISKFPLSKEDISLINFFLNHLPLYEALELLQETRCDLNYLAEWLMNWGVYTTGQQTSSINLDSLSSSPFLPVDIYLTTIGEQVTPEEMEFLIETLREDILSIFDLPDKTIAGEQT